MRSERNRILLHSYIRLVLLAALVGLASALLALSLKHLTEYFEHQISGGVSRVGKGWVIVLPTIGITAIYFLRKWVFKGRKNKGITEIYKTLYQRKDHLPLFKIPAHYLNGFLTVIFGGSTGVEVSTVVATATIGNSVYDREVTPNLFKSELICAGVTAGVAVLFASPLAGALFATEVIAKKVTKSGLLSCATAAGMAALIIHRFDNRPLLPFAVTDWKSSALPFFALLGVLGGGLAVYFTFLVTRMKGLFVRIENNFLRVNAGAIAVGLLLFGFPALYGDSYHGLRELLAGTHVSLLLLLALMLLKPLAAALTLGAGGDGGVFAPSIVAGAFLGLLFATVCNRYFGMELIPLNFALVGAAATLSAALFAPTTALVLACGLLPNGFSLLVPVLLGSFVAQAFAKKLLPYNVYTYDFYLAGKAG